MATRRRPGYFARLVLWAAVQAAIAPATFGSPGLPPSTAPAYPFAFRDVGDEVGLFPDLTGVRGHAVAWGDADGDGYPDLFVGTFHEGGSKTSQFFRNVGGKFHLDDQPALRLSSCASGAVFVDLTNNGRLDLYVNNNAHGTDGPKAALPALFRNDGAGRFTDVSKDSGACPPNFQGRTVAALDFDGDGLLDLLACDFYYSTKATAGVALYRNLGNHRFEDVASRAGLPRGSAVAGCAVADVNGDTRPDVFLTFADGSNRLFLNAGNGTFREAPGTRDVFAWNDLKADNSPTGVCIADVNRDGRPDIVVGHHFKTPWRQPAPVRLYLNRGPKPGDASGDPVFEDVTEAAGLTPLAMKAPHVEFQDFDNDGWPDLYVSIVKFKDGKPYPVIYRNQGVRPGDVPHFRDDAWAVNDFPAPDDLPAGKGGTGPFFDRLLANHKITYAAAAPAADFDRDGRMDIFLATWWTESRCLLLKNETPGGNHWLEVQLRCANGVNRMGVGSRVNVYPAGQLGRADALLGGREIAVGYGWCSGQEAVAHFGLGGEMAVDVEVILPHGKGRLERRGVKANQRIVVER